MLVNEEEWRGGALVDKAYPNDRIAPQYSPRVDRKLCETCP